MPLVVSLLYPSTWRHETAVSSSHIDAAIEDHTTATT